MNSSQLNLSISNNSIAGILRTDVNIVFFHAKF